MHYLLWAFKKNKYLVQVIWHPLMSEPGQGGRDALRLVVQWQCRQSPPRRAAGSELDDAGREHHAEQQPADEHQRYVIARLRAGVGRASSRSDDDGQEADLQHEDVPLEPHERLPDLQREKNIRTRGLRSCCDS